MSTRPMPHNASVRIETVPSPGAADVLARWTERLERLGREQRLRNDNESCVTLDGHTLAGGDAR